MDNMNCLSFFVGFEFQLLQEAEEWKEKVNELNKQKITFEDSKVYAKQVLCDKENQIKVNGPADYRVTESARILYLF